MSVHLPGGWYVEATEFARPGGCPVVRAGHCPSAEQRGVFAAASLKNALDAIAADWQGRDRQAGRRQLRGELGARQADRAGRAGRHLLLGRPRLDGLSEERESDQADSGRTCSATRSSWSRRPTESADDRAGLRPRRAAGGRQARDGQPTGPGRQIRQGGAGEARRLGARRGRVAQADNVRAALRSFRRGEAPLGIVYATDANAEPDVKVLGDLPRRQPSADRLSGGAHRSRPTPTPRRSSTSCAAARRAALSRSRVSASWCAPIRRRNIAGEQRTASMRTTRAACSSSRSNVKAAGSRPPHVDGSGDPVPRVLGA